VTIMKRPKSGLIDMTPLLDVVFILLFALILNVNVTRAKDKVEAEAAVAEVESQLAETNQDNRRLERERALQQLEIEALDRDSLEYVREITRLNELIQEASEKEEQND